MTVYVTCYRCRGLGYLQTTVTVAPTLCPQCPDCQGWGTVPINQDR
jgi:hypothetical protein